jgi:serine/threonine-protein kinase
MNSTNGTFVNGERIKEKVLQPGDHLGIGLGSLLFEGEPGAPSAKPKAPGALRFCSQCGGSVPAKHLGSGKATWVSEKLLCIDCLPKFVTKQIRRSKEKEEPRHIRPEEFIGKILTGNKIIEKVADGNLGTVFRAEHVTLHRPVAIKILAPAVTNDKTWVKSYLRKAHEGGQLVHPNIVLIYDIGESDGVFYIAMEYVPGETVRAMVKRLKRIAPAKAVNIATQIAHAIEHAQQHNAVHRDIKPKNILVDKQGVAKLLGFGFSAFALRAPSKVLAKSHSNVRDFRFSSPEVFKPKEALDFRSDIYSLGATLYYMLTGTAPFHAETNRELAEKVQSEQPRPVRAIAEEVSEHLARVIAKMIAKSPENRYQTSQELLSDLQQAAQEFGKKAT